jgi:hypothetical protein
VGWQQIVYPPLPIPGAARDRMHVGVAREELVGAPGNVGATSHMRFNLTWGGTKSNMPKTISNAANIRAELHTADGKVAPSGKPIPQWIGVSGGGGGDATWYLVYGFPWGRNALDEAWIRLDVGGQVYWIEMPYGFARNSAEPEVSDPTRGLPHFPPTMRTLGDKDILVPWLHVDYDLGEIQNQWRLSLELSNPFDARGEIMLYRHDIELGKSMDLWRLDSPRTAMDIQWPEGNALKGRQTGSLLHDDGLRRSDVYSFNRWPSDVGRAWGTVVVQVDDQSYSCRIPSSLFMYVHGVTDPENKKRLHAPGDPPWELDAVGNHVESRDVANAIK